MNKYFIKRFIYILLCITLYTVSIISISGIKYEDVIYAQSYEEKKEIMQQCSPLAVSTYQLAPLYDNAENKKEEDKKDVEISASTPVAGISVTLEKLENVYADIDQELQNLLNLYNIDLINSLSDNDIGMIERLVEAEATQGGVKEKAFVASVILNRLASDNFPNTIEKIIFQKVSGYYQFTPVIDKRYWSVSITDDTKEAVQYVIENGDTSMGALFFCNPPKVKKSSTKSWFDEKLEFLFKDDIGHHYYTLKTKN